ncbi:unnamed protein product [Eruca vesicaria subsp. sativa]|uniref:RPW8 domain-containing protein n=1 Tax=Eruca vesicaria subsp. sativa TaxID=29727 RepID=A0ABC8JEB6_ERUVS|nr:unnamed protein product [Eruca vesicaria subsp. sativa]
MAELIGEVMTEAALQLFMVSRKAYGCKGVASNLADMIVDIQPTISEIRNSGVTLPPHREAQLSKFSETLEKCLKLTNDALKTSRWNISRQLYQAKKMEALEKRISSFLRCQVLAHILADVHLIRADSDVRFSRVDRSLDSMNRQMTHVLSHVHHLQATCEMRFDCTDRSVDRVNEQMCTFEVRFDRTDRNFDTLSDQLGSMSMRRGVSVLGDVGDFCRVGLDWGKRTVKGMLFKLEDEGRLIGISGMSGSGKTTLAREIMLDEEVQGHFENQILFLTVSQSPNLEELRGLILGFFSAYDDDSSRGQTRKLLILDDVCTRRSLDQLFFKRPGTTTLVVSRSKLADPKATYHVELLNEDEATSLFCLSAFDQTSIPSGFNIKLVKQIVEECKGLPLSLKVIGGSLKDQPEIYWQGAVKRLSKGEPVDETHESRVFAQMEATLETLDPKTRECFLDLGAFPEDKKIPLDVIINMWVELHDLEEETAFAVLVDLSHKNLLTLVKDPRLGALYTGHYDIFVMQHDGLRDLAIHISNRGSVSRRVRLLMPRRELGLPREWERNSDEPFNARIVSIHTGEMTETDWFDMELPKAEVLILNFTSDNYAMPPFISKMRSLRALVIINNGMSFAQLKDFPSFTNLAKLRSLWLEMVHVPELSNNMVPLKSLYKLSLIFCKVNDSFDQRGLDMVEVFPNLSDLTIDHCDDLVELPSTICGINSVKSISITNCPGFVELPKNLSKLKSLELLRLYACSELESLPEEICELQSLKYLDISQCMSLSSLPEELGKLSKLEKIDMRECSLCSIPSSGVSLTSLRHVICDEESLCMWEEVKKVVPGLLVEAADTCLSMD